MNTIDLALRIFDHTQDHTLCLMYKQKYNKKFTFFYFERPQRHRKQGSKRDVFVCSVGTNRKSNNIFRPISRPGGLTVLFNFLTLPATIKLVSQIGNCNNKIK